MGCRCACGPCCLACAFQAVDAQRSRGAGPTRTTGKRPYSLSEPSLKDPRYHRWGYRHARSPRSLAGDDCPVPPPSPPVQHLPPGQRPQTAHSPAAQSPVTSQTALVRPTPRTLLFASPSAARAAGAPSPGWGDGGGGGTGAMSEGIVFPGTCVSLPADTLALTQPFTPRPLEP